MGPTLVAAQRQTWGVVPQNAQAKPEGAAAAFGHWVQWQPRVSPGYEVVCQRCG